jgi:hypothetical protein
MKRRKVNKIRLILKLGWKIRGKEMMSHPWYWKNYYPEQDLLDLYND